VLNEVLLRVKYDPAADTYIVETMDRHGVIGTSITSEDMMLSMLVYDGARDLFDQALELRALAHDERDIDADG
jgi:hypothetical protein